jgi:hypothetical protein
MFDINSRIENFRGLNFDNLSKQVKTGKSLIFNAKQLKVPGLSPDCIVAKFYQDAIGSLRFAVPCIYREGDKLVLSLPDFAQTKIDFELISVKITPPVSAIVNIEGNEFTVSISLDADYRDSNKETEIENVDADDFDNNNVNPLPINQIPLKNLDKGDYQAINNGGKSNYGDMLVDLVDLKTKLAYKNVISNAHLKTILADGKQHKISITGHQKSRTGGIEVILCER